MEENKVYFHTPDENGTISISPDVIAGIAADACLETQGVASMANGPQGCTKGVVIKVTDEGCNVDSFIMVRNGFVIADVAKEVQVAVKTAIEAGCGIKVLRSDVYVAGIEMKA